MPYNSKSELPDGVKKLPSHAQEIYMAAFNSAWDEYKDEGKAAATAWTAVKTKYEQDKDGNWKAKENEDWKLPADVAGCVTEESIRRRYADLVGLAATKASNSGAAKALEGVITVINGLTESADPAAVTAASGNIEAAWKLVAAMEVVKTEDGQEYPAAAYAYVPDKETPSTWKLRIWEDPTKKVTRKQLGAAAAALSTGGFRGQKADIPSEDLPAVKRKLRAEYRKLDVSDDDMPKWVKETEMRTLILDFIPLTEATIGTKGRGTVRIIKPGFNESKTRYYPAEMLAREYGVFEGNKMYADHPTEAEEQARPERSIKDWVAVLENVRVRATDGALIGDYSIVEPWFESKLAMLRDKKQLDKIGVSINAVGSATRQKVEGVETNYVEKLVVSRSVDFVTEPGAGGGVELFEADGKTLDVDLISPAYFKERRPDIVKDIEDGVKSQYVKEAKRMSEQDEKIKTLETEKETLAQENASLKEQAAAADKAKAVAEAQAKIKETLDKAQLPEAARARLTERFKEADTDAGVAEAIKSEQDYIASLAEAGKVKGLGNTDAEQDATKDREALVKSFKETYIRQGKSEKDAQRMAETAVNR